MEASDKGIGILVPTTGQRSDWLLRCLRSLDKDEAISEVVIVCPEHSEAAVKEIISSSGLSYVPTLENDSGDGLSAALNIGMARFKSNIQFVSWIGDDDFLHPGFASTLASLLETRPEASFAVGSCAYLNQAGQVFFTQRPRRVNLPWLTVFANPVPQPSSMIRRSAWQAAGGLNPDLKFAMDLDLWIRLLDIGPAVLTDKMVASYTWHDASLSGNNELASFLESREVRRLHARFPWRILQELVDLVSLAFIRLAKSRLNRLS